jgi:hypothetical protein
MADLEPIDDIMKLKTEKLTEIQLDVCRKCNKRAVDTVKCLKCGAFRNGGKRENSGRKILPRTIETMEVKRKFVERVNKAADRLYNAQLDIALGEKFLMVRIPINDEKSKYKTEVVTDPDIIAEYIDDNGVTLNNSGDDYYYMTTRPANNQAIQSMLDRAFGKAPEKIEIEGSFFKANKLEINIVQKRNEDDIIDGDIIEDKDE